MLPNLRLLGRLEFTMALPQPNPRPFISEPLTWEQICDRYPDQWVCLVEVDHLNDRDFEFYTGRVVGHGATRKEPLEQAKAFGDTYLSIAHYHTSLFRDRHS
jgi:hypothetical protein